MSKPCRDCGAPIDFIKSPAGQWIVVEAVEVDPKLLGEDELCYSHDGNLFTAGELRERSGVLLAHWPTCPGSEKFRKNKEKINEHD